MLDVRTYVHTHVRVAACAACTQAAGALCRGSGPSCAVLLAMSKKGQLKPVDDKGRSMVPSWDQSILGSIRGLTDDQKRRVEEKLSPVC